MRSQRILPTCASYVAHAGPLVAALTLAAIPLAFSAIREASTSSAVQALEVPKEILVKVAAALLVLVAGVRYIRRDPLVKPPPLAVGVIVAFACFYTLAAVISDDRVASTAALQQIGVFTVFAIAAIIVPGVARWGITGLAVAGGIVAVMVLAQVLGFELRGWRDVEAMVSPAASFMHRNRAACLVALSIPVALSWRSRWAYAALPLLASALVVTRSRGAWIVALVGMIVFVVFDSRARKAALARCTVVAAASVIAAALAWSAGHQSDTLETRILHDYGSVRARWKLWDAAVAVIADHPLFGAGPGQFAAAAARHHAGPLPSLQADDEILATASEAGIPAAACLVALALMAATVSIIGGRRARDSNAAMLCAIVCALIAASLPEALVRQGAYSAIAGLVIGAGVAGGHMSRAGPRRC